MKNIKKIIKTKRSKTKDSKIIVDTSLDNLKNIEFKSGKQDEINKIEFKLSF